ncbi:MAG: GNAT family N-acetyltransferase [bacterium]|nr:GNAT family N-acetyltransferase [bacterium]
MNEAAFTPPPILNSARLLLRPVNRDDLDLVYAFNADERNLRYVAREPWTAKAQALVRIDEWTDGFAARATMMWAFEHGPERAPAGYGGFFGIDAEADKAEIGYGLLPAYWGRGLAGEAVDAMVAWGFGELKLHRIHARVHPGNTASERLLARRGFQVEGLLKHDSRARGQWFDSALFGLIDPAAED